MNVWFKASGWITLIISAETDTVRRPQQAWSLWLQEQWHRECLQLYCAHSRPMLCQLHQKIAYYMKYHPLEDANHVCAMSFLSRDMQITSHTTGIVWHETKKKLHIHRIFQLLRPSHNFNWSFVYLHKSTLDLQYFQCLCNLHEQDSHKNVCGKSLCQWI